MIEFYINIEFLMNIFQLYESCQNLVFLLPNYLECLGSAIIEGLKPLMITAFFPLNTHYSLIMHNERETSINT